MKLVKLTNANKWPDHMKGYTVFANPLGKWELWRGKEIVIETAHMPDEGWTCGTKQVFVVSKETLLRMGADVFLYPRIVVCEHQIQADEGPTA